MRDGLRFGLLGPPVVYGADGEVRTIGSGKVRALLAALLLEPGRVVSVDALKDALWGGAPPASAQASLQNHVTRLRRLLGDDGPERLRAVPPGYLLRVDEGELDVRVFEEHLVAARAAHAARAWEDALREASAALALWRGTPLSGLPHETGAHALVQRLQEARLLVLEWRYDAELRLGGARFGSLVPELAALVAEHPLREGFHRLLMLALHRTGRPAEALAVHRDLRARLIEELGVEPGAAVREAHLEILREGRAATGDGTGADDRRADDPYAERRLDTDPAKAPRPAQLPPAPAHFTGREAVREDLLRFLAAERDAPGIALVSGMAGVGKSALALHVAHGLRERFPDGQLYVNLHGATPGMTPLTPEQALAALLRDLGAESHRTPEHPDAAASLLRSLLAPTRTLMVLDDAAHAAQVRPLLPGGPGCAVIVTSRSPLTALDGAHRVPLAPLSDEDSAALLRAVSGRDGLHAGHPLVELAGRLPLALRIVAARLAARRALTPDMLAGQLAATEGRLHHLEYDDLSVRRSLAVAHDALRASDREADRDAARALARIGALDLPGYGAPLLARLLGADERRAEAALDRLVDVALLEETAYGRYAPHDLVRDFAHETVASEQGVEPERSGAEVALRWYAAMATRALEALVEPGTERTDRLRATPSQPGTHTADVASVPAFGSAEAAADWIVLELENIVALVERHADTSAYVPLLVRMITSPLQRRGRVAESEALVRAALRGARGLADAPAEAYALLDMAGVQFLKGRGNDALVLLDEALEIWRRLGDLSCLCRGLNNRGLLLGVLGRYEESGEALRRCLEYTRVLDDPMQEAITYSNLGNLYEHTDPRGAIGHHRRSLEIGERIGHVIIRHSAHCNMGFAHLALGEPDAAVPHFEESLRILGGHGHWQGESQTRLGLVRALRDRGDAGRAARECDVLLCLAARRGDRYTEGLARHQRGLLCRAEGDAEQARRQWEAALSALERTDSPVAGELRELLAEG
ncbi:BTAD domain-containing putative transcriptional regulator [Streptomyces sp. Ru72]|uniref:AfsR/SARP family transcriptional regulator n=1 Tax=Streptomyces sp. Ru72 TaxID=2080747 RepID=UPI000CDE5313|nr:BTAD domain-containing putative transcriptional regulator [Streptomyces sp. Ru72]POX49364.1 transcriptional regulator [Streptomyces sp. Ru72]